MDAGEPLMAHLATSEGAVRDFLTRHGNQSILAVPILAGSRVWGSLGIDSCSAGLGGAAGGSSKASGLKPQMRWPSACIA